MFGKTSVQRALKKKRNYKSERNKIPRTKALKEHKQAIKDESKQVLFTVTNNPALPNIQDIPRKKQPILYSTERLKTKYTKKSLLSLSYAHLIFVTYSFVKKTRKHRQFTRDPRCNSKQRCLTCPYIDNGRRSSYTFINARETRNTRHHVTLRPYLSAKNSTQVKRNARFANTSLNTGKQLAIHLMLMPKQQSQSGHSIIDMELISLELQPAHSTSRRKAQVVYLIDRHKTLSPDGINRRKNNH